jgi:hypothetical protein
VRARGRGRVAVRAGEVVCTPPPPCSSDGMWVAPPPTPGLRRGPRGCAWLVRLVTRRIDPSSLLLRLLP